MGGALLSCSVSRIALFVVSLPSFSFLFCVLYSLLANFKESTETHCHVSNLLPSISAAIGSFAPQKYVWRIGIGLHSGPRYVYAWMYWNQHRSVLPWKYQYLAHVAFVLELIEDSCLLGLSMVSSSDDYPTHEKCFITFLLTSILYQCLCVYALPRVQTRHGLHYKRSLALKQKCFYVTLVCSIICAITFYRHNSHCEPYMYTGFALAEYSIVLSNIVFHGTAYYDFHGTNFVAVASDGDGAPLLKRAAF